MTESIAPQGSTSVTRWRRFGHDRLYVKDAGGAGLGYWNLETDTAHPSEAQWLLLLTAAVEGWRASAAAGPAPAPAATPSAGRPPVTTERPWVDLATNLPGELVRERALLERDAAPVRTVLARVLDLKTEERSWRLGATGEAKVGRQLAKLVRRDPRWRVLHAIPVGERGSDIDHLVIGPGGVFTVNAKHHPDATVRVCGNSIYVDGHRTHYVRNARFESDRAARLLSQACGTGVAVEGLVVPVNAAKVDVRNQPAGVHVVPRRQLADWLQRLGQVLDQDRAARIYDAARRSTTWRP